KLEQPASQGNGTGRHQNHRQAIFLQARDIVAQRSQPVAAQFALGTIHQQRRADLRDNQFGAREYIAQRRCFIFARFAVLPSALGLALALPVGSFALGLTALVLSLALPSFLACFALAFAMGETDLAVAGVAAFTA